MNRIIAQLNIQSPLEQFEVAPLNLSSILFINTLTNNFSIINIFMLSSTLILLLCNNIITSNNFTMSFCYLPNCWHRIIDIIYETVSQVITDNLFGDNNKYFPILTMLFLFIFTGNLLGLIPYSITITSQLVITFTLSFSVFVGIHILIMQKYKNKTFSLFLPSNTTFFLALLLVPVEFIAYMAKPISLGLRLFINLMAGHSLLKVVAGLSWNILVLESISSLAFVLPIFVLIVLFTLELGVAFIQTYVFIMLTCIYLNDSK